MKKTMPVFILLIALFSVSNVLHAQAPVREPLRQIAAVNIEDVRVIIQVKNSFTLSFLITNGDGAQSGVQYGVRLVQQTPQGQVIYDEKVYEEKLTLPAYSQVKKEITYDAPSQLQGTFSLYITSYNSNGFPFGIAAVGTATLYSTEGGVIVETASCTVQKGDDPVGSINRTVSIEPGEQLTLRCSVRNTENKAVTVVPVYENRYKNAFGDIAAQEGIDVQSISFGPLETKTITLPLSLPEKPDIYRYTVRFRAGTVDSNSVPINYVIRGESATIYNVSLNKEDYQKGEKAKSSIAFVASVSKGSFTTELKNRYGKTCAEPITQSLPVKDRLATLVEIPVESRCVGSQLKVTVANADGVTLDSEVFTLVSEPMIGRKQQAIIVGALLIILFGTSLYIIRRRSRFTTEQTIV